MNIVYITHNPENYTPEDGPLVFTVIHIETKGGTLFITVKITKENQTNGT